MGDVFFDLANFSINHGLDAEGRRVLLEAYAGSVRRADERALTLMMFMSDFREAMWGVVQRAISTLEFDFDAYADEHFARLERTAADPRFGQRWRLALERQCSAQRVRGAGVPEHGHRRACLGESETRPISLSHRGTCRMSHVSVAARCA